ncbi:bifunctional 5,10-methylene-tetrahydrofolate dehydrogenase/5,10-methylene-tetrahydrofolate cyclohydrolase [Anaerofilum sp. BX8]|uniref:Bifunctional protein FolD n=1 Tax=Anaerofilum hominis TaxID=2763016 RepID=A0A923L1H9_9FIRM|nr:tetrahydrofolate dehydrogenase/cyclohydrolase catalytic domain-containing protein [Anaerofilum hominis]MBC5582067.1 bifunctional 5,10-methylene-tetrahydrofolate dehydrogenase/5,10-methylene-tetrahydrofolate cyclohydrolase [Anaerofilum hominis]
MERIDGKALAAKVKAQVAAEVEALRGQGVVPKLTVILVGEDPASQVYVGGKAKDCAQCGIDSEVLRLPDSTTEAQLLAEIAVRNSDPTVSGLLVQLPLPRHINEKKVIEAISPEKDVDGFTPVNVGRLVIGEDCFLPCTPAGCIELLKATGEPLEGKRAVVLGRSNIVGKPMALLLLRENATVTVCHSRTRDLPSVVREADILVAAIGKKRFVTPDMVKEGALVVDVGINRGEDGKLYGDVDEPGLADKAGRITPVPGGVGLMTRAMLMVNTLKAAKRQHGLD